MEKRPRNESPIGKARHFLHCVLLEQRAAIEELKASNRELERLLDEILSTRTDLRPVSIEEAVEEAPPARAAVGARRVVDAKREVESVMEQGAAAIKESMRLRRRSERIRSALQVPGSAKPAHTGQGLSKREHQVLCLIVAGKSSKEIAAELGISFKTTVTHRASIMSKLDVHEIASVVREAIRRGLV
jgi:DNA-binding NarL/FixJ family response regulator